MTTRQKTKLKNAFENNISAYTNLSRPQISKILQCGGILGSSLSKLAGPLMKVAVALAKYIWALLGTAAPSGIDARIPKKKGSGTIPLTISNNEMNDVMKIVQALEDSNILLKGVTKTTANETKEQKWGFLGKLLGTLKASLSGNMLIGNTELLSKWT